MKQPRGRQVFDAPIVNFSCDPCTPHRFPQKRGLPPVRLGQRYPNFRTAYRNDDAGQSRARPVIQQSFDIRRQMLGGKGTLDKVALDHLLWFADRS